MKNILIILIMVIGSSCNTSMKLTTAPFKGVAEDSTYVVFSCEEIPCRPGYYLVEIYSKQYPNKNYAKIITIESYNQGETLTALFSKCK